MLTYEYLVWMFFRSLDSLVLIAFGAWLVVRKLLPYVRNRMAIATDERDALLGSIHYLEQEKERLNEQALADQHTIERLEQKIRIWQQSIKRKHLRDTTEKEDILVRLFNRNEQRTKIIAEEKAAKSIFELALNRAEQALDADELKDQKKIFLDELIRRMRLEDASE